MSDDWQPGDLALCVRQRPWKQIAGPPHYGPDPKPGCIYSVKRVGGDQFGLFLVIKELPDVDYGAQNFRKIRPHTPDEEDRLTIALLNREIILVDDPWAEGQRA